MTKFGEAGTSEKFYFHKNIVDPYSHSLQGSYVYG